MPEEALEFNGVPNPMPWSVSKILKASLRPYALGLAVTLGVTAASPLLPPQARAQTITQKPRDLTGFERNLYIEAFAAADRGEWIRARALAAQGGDPLLNKIMRWLYLSQPENYQNFHELREFLFTYPGWPNEDQMRSIVEDKMEDGIGDNTLLLWFARYTPYSGMGVVRLAEALYRKGYPIMGDFWLHHGWIEKDYTPEQQEMLLKKYRPRLPTKVQEARFDRLVWSGKNEDAERLLEFLSRKRYPVAQARLALAQDDPKADQFWNRLLPEDRTRPGLLFERLHYLRDKGRIKDALLFLENEPEDLVIPERWWQERKELVKQAIKEERYEDAYKLTAKHFQKRGDAFAEAEWMSGWIALRLLKKPKIALKHFESLFQRVATADARSQAAYWAGRSWQALLADEDAEDWYKIAAKFSTHFYGHLSTEKLGRERSINLPRPIDVPLRIRRALKNFELTYAAERLIAINRGDLADPFLHKMATMAKEVEHSQAIADLALDMKRYSVSIFAAKRAQRRGFNLAYNAFPVPDIPGYEEGRNALEKAFVMAVIRERSEFDPNQVDEKTGGRGLMSLTRTQGRSAARLLGVDYEPTRLTKDPAYNVRLGQALLRAYLKKHKNNYVLALSAFHAGPEKTEAWIKQLGTPRKDTDTAIDWIEWLPERQTRDFIMSVLEGLQVYRYRLAPRGEEQPVRLSADLSKFKPPPTR